MIPRASPARDPLLVDALHAFHNRTPIMYPTWNQELDAAFVLGWDARTRSFRRPRMAGQSSVGNVAQPSRLQRWILALIGMPSRW